MMDPKYLNPKNPEYSPDAAKSHRESQKYNKNLGKKLLALEKAKEYVIKAYNQAPSIDNEFLEIDEEEYYSGIINGLNAYYDKVKDSRPY